MIVAVVIVVVARRGEGGRRARSQRSPRSQGRTIIRKFLSLPSK
jgi:hypothetical protein